MTLADCAVTAAVLLPPFGFGVIVGYAWGKGTEIIKGIAHEQEMDDFFKRERLP